jgi:pimeloyl-ACP methyl ester carboxylesterase
VPNLKYEYVKLSHGRTRYIEAGSGAPVILIHGAGYLANADNWLPVLPALSERYRCLAMDCLNWGLGDPLDREFSFAYLVDFIREFQDAMGLKKSHIVGHSMGGWLADLLAYESPQRVDKLVDSAGGGMATRALTNMVNFQPPSSEEIRKQAATKLKSMGAQADALVEEYVTHLSRPEVATAFGKVMRHMTDPATRQRYHLARRLPYITAPTLIVWGRNDEVNDVAMAEEKHKLIANSKVHYIDDCGHFIQQQKPAEFSRAVSDFLG